MKFNKKKNSWYILGILLLIIGIGYALLSTTLKIDGLVNLKGNTWNIYFDNFQETPGSVVANPAPVIVGTNTTELEYTVDFTKPGDFYEFTVDAVNGGSIDGMIDVVSNNAYNSTGTTEITLPSYLKSSVTYIDGSEIKQNHLLSSGKSETFRVRVEFDKNVDVGNLPSNDETITFKFSTIYKQANDDAKPRYICVRATELHTEICKENSNMYCGMNTGYNDNIIYGNLGASGQLNSGDAFDCDVNGDGVYDSETERFYYVSDYYNPNTNEFDNKYAALIYYSGYYNSGNNSGPTNSRGSSYSSSGHNDYGPTTAVSYLPKADNWKTVSLINKERQMRNQLGGTTADGYDLPKFTYNNVSARLITIQEVLNGCGTDFNSLRNSNSLSSCTYLLEQSLYSRGLSNAISLIVTETPVSFGHYYAWELNTSYVDVSTYQTTGYSYLIKPVIELDKNSLQINYENYTITFDKQNGESNETKSIIKRTKIGTLPEPIKLGYIFEGWYTSSTGGTKITPNTKPKGNVTYYAHYIKADATFLPGQEFLEKTGSKISRHDVTVFERYSGIPDISLFDNSNIVSTEDSNTPIYIWKDLQDFNHVYWWSLDTNPKLNEDCTNMFAAMTGITELDLSDFDISNVKIASGMFVSMTNLVTLYVNESFNIDNITASNLMFAGDYAIVGEKGTVYDTNYMDKTYARIDGGTSNPGYLTKK